MHTRKDVNFLVTRSLPAQNSNNNSTAIDLEIAAPQLAGEYCEVEFSIPATTCATGQTITVTLQDSADNSTFTQIDECETLVLTGASNATAAAIRRWRLPRTCLRYIRVNIAMSATTGDQTAVISELALLF
jgi:hypothetical protein